VNISQKSTIFLLKEHQQNKTQEGMAPLHERRRVPLPEHQKTQQSSGSQEDSWEPKGPEGAPRAQGSPGAPQSTQGTQEHQGPKSIRGSSRCPRSLRGNNGSPRTPKNPRCPGQPKATEEHPPEHPKCDEEETLETESQQLQLMGGDDPT